MRWRGNGFLQDVETIDQREQGMFAERDDQGFFFRCSKRSSVAIWTHRGILNISTLTPLGDGLGLTLYFRRAIFPLRTILLHDTRIFVFRRTGDSSP
jgi:hypothetical protein